MCKEEPRRTDLDFLRIVSCFLVIVNHTNTRVFRSTVPSLTWFVSLTYFFVCKIAVPMFLFLMGALLLGRRDTPRKSLARVARIFVVFFLVSGAYYLFYRRDDLASASLADFLRCFFAGGRTSNALWYLCLYLALLCILPLMQAMAAAFTKGQLELLLFLSLGVLGTVPLLSALTPLELTMFSRYGVIFNPYLGIVFAGYYLDRYVEITRRRAWIAAAVFTALILFQVAATYRLYQINPASYLALDDRTMLTVTGSTACCFVLVKYLFSRRSVPEGARRLLAWLSGLTFGVYLISDCMIEVLAPVLELLQAHMHIFPATVLWEVCIFLAGAAVTAALRAVPPLRKLL